MISSARLELLLLYYNSNGSIYLDSFNYKRIIYLYSFKSYYYFMNYSLILIKINPIFFYPIMMHSESDH